RRRVSVGPGRSGVREPRGGRGSRSGARVVGGTGIALGGTRRPGGTSGGGGGSATGNTRSTRTTTGEGVLGGVPAHGIAVGRRVGIPGLALEAGLVAGGVHGLQRVGVAEDPRGRSGLAVP